MMQRRCEEQVERARDHALAGVLDRHDAEIGGAGARRVKHLVDLAQGTCTIDEPK